MSESRIYRTTRMSLLLYAYPNPVKSTLKYQTKKSALIRVIRDSENCQNHRLTRMTQITRIIEYAKDYLRISILRVAVKSPACNV